MMLAMMPHLQPGSLPVGHTVELEQSWNVGKSNLIEDYDETKQNIKKFVRGCLFVCIYDKDDDGDDFDGDDDFGGDDDACDDGDGDFDDGDSP